MRIALIITFLCLISNIIRSQIDFDLHFTKSQWYESAPKGFDFVPSGSYQDTVYYHNDTIIQTTTIAPFWMSNEITNKEFREFTLYLNNNLNDSLCYYDLSHTPLENDTDKSKYLLCFSNKDIAKDIIDTVTFNAYYPEYSDYFNNKKYNKYPVVGVSFDGARFFSIWKTKTEKEKHGSNYLMNDYRIPVEEEYKYVISKTKDKNPKKIKNLKKVNSGKKNSFRLYNICGNVAEWAYSSSDNISIKNNTVIEGSWIPKPDLKEKTVAYKASNDHFVGFRLVRSYLSKKNKN